MKRTIYTVPNTQIHIIDSFPIMLGTSGANQNGLDDTEKEEYTGGNVEWSRREKTKNVWGDEEDFEEEF